MAKYTLHNRVNDFMHDTARTIDTAIDKCKKKNYRCKVMETYYAKSPWSQKVTEHGKEVYRNY
jgi:hypothetical protein